MIVYTPYTINTTKYFNVTCKQSISGTDKKIGSTKKGTANRNGYENSRNYGTSVKAGKYYSIFDMTSNNGVSVISSNVVMKTSK